MGRVIGGFMDTWIGGKKYHTTKGSGVTAYEIVDWQVNLCVTHSGLHPSVQGGGYWYWQRKYCQSPYMSKYVYCLGKY